MAISIRQIIRRASDGRLRIVRKGEFWHERIQVDSIVRCRCARGDGQHLDGPRLAAMARTQPRRQGQRIQSAGDLAEGAHAKVEGYAWEAACRRLPWWAIACIVFARDGDDEILRCLNAETGDEVWQTKYPAEALRGGGDGGYAGPRSSPTVANGKVVTLGVHGVLCCFDAATGKELWRNDEFENETPNFHTSSSPIVVDGLCIAQLGG